MMEPRRLRVLLVDDHAMVRRGLAAFLKAFDDLELAGEAAQGEEAMQRCAEVQPDVVLMDLEMPVMDGYEATRKLREIERTKNRKRLLIIAISSNDEEAIVKVVVVARQPRMQDLDGDGPVEDLVLPLPHLGHPAAVDQSDEAVAAGQDGLCDDPSVGHHLRVLIGVAAVQVRASVSRRPDRPCR